MTTFNPGQILTAEELNLSFSGKTDNEAAAITGGTVSGLTSLQVAGTLDSTSPSTGAVVVMGGVGIALDVQVGGNVTVGGAVIVNENTQSTSTTTGAFVVVGGAGIGGNVNVGGSVDINGSLSVVEPIEAASTTDSTSNSTGALIVIGGAAIGKTLNVYGAANITGVLTAIGGVTLQEPLTFPDASTQSTAGVVNGEFSNASAGGTVTISAAQSAANSIFKFTGGLTSNLVAAFPAAPKNLTIQNETTGAFSLTIEATGQTPSVVVPQGTAAALFTDSTGCYSPVTPSTPFAAAMTAWFNSLPTTFPSSSGILWNNGGTLAQS
jgi:hypothetical protein